MVNNVDILRAAKIIRSGGLVAFPTETVYGLGANATDQTACMRIFEAKGRPSDNPLIVHVSSLEQLLVLTPKPTSTMEALAKAFWPGPLTLIVPNESAPRAVTGGRNTVAVRIPSHPVAQALINAAGVPIAAPSANTSGKPSATSADHVQEDLGDKIDMIIDGGPTEFGIESTILDLSEEVPCLLRPGFVTHADIEGVIGQIDIHPSIWEAYADGSPKAPGMAYAHYQPKATLYIAQTRDISSLISSSVGPIGVITTDDDTTSYVGAKVFSLGPRSRADICAKNLFKTLRDLDKNGIDTAYVIPLEGEGIEIAIMNRLRKAAGYKFVV